MKDSPSPSTFDQRTILSGMTGSGKFRAVFVTGPSNQNKSKKLAELGTAIVRKEPSSFCVLLDSRKTQTPYEWCSQFARTLRTMNGAEPMALAKFAMAVGRSLIPFKPGGAESSPESEANEKVVSKLVEHFEQLTEHLPKGANSPKLIIVMDKFESMNNEMLSWLSTTLNQAFRQSSSFTASRFIFSANQKSPDISEFFSKFGFDKVHEFIFGGLSNPADSRSLEKSADKEKSLDDESDLVAGSDESRKKLKVSGSNPKISNMGETKSGQLLDHAKDFFSNFSDAQKKHLILASYARRISRYNLEFFSTSREAALSYNWLKRQSEICERLECGNFTLKQDIAQFARAIHAIEKPEESEKWSTLSSVLEAFYAQFPDETTHWVPINLQTLNWFNDSLLKKLFVEDQYITIQNFITSHENVVSEDGSRLAMTEESKLLTRRVIDLSHLEPYQGLVGKAREQWLLDSEKSSTKSARLMNEKKNLISDIEGGTREVSNLHTMKEQLEDNFKKPSNLKPERILSFSSSLLLIVIGLGVVGLSLLSDSLGSYHAACGLGLTLFGFFWPTVELKRATELAEISNSPLTIDAQQRSLDNRISNLNNRLKLLNTNLCDIEAQLTKLEEKGIEPYVDIDE